jgi:glycosyltransferase involved in cell wall biosynthesis
MKTVGLFAALRADRESACAVNARRPSHGVVRERITMLLENNPYPQDTRVRAEAESLVAAGHRVEVIAPRASRQPAREQVNGVEVRRFRVLQLQGGGLLALLLEYAIAMVALHIAAVRALVRGSTALHLHNPPDTLFLAGAMFRVAPRRRVVFDHHDLVPELVEVRFGGKALVGLARICERLTFAAASHVLAANESHAEVAVERGNKHPDTVTVVRNGPPVTWIRRPLHVRGGSLAPVRLAYLGTVAEQDGLNGMAEVLACLRDRTPPVDARLTVIGDGDGRAAFEDALRRWAVAGMVTMTGWVEADRVPELLQDADLCVDPAPATALNQRSTMIKLGEYLALGKPVVAYDLLESRRTVADAAILVPSGDARAFAEQVARLARDPALRCMLASRARDRAGDLTWEASKPALLAAYASLRAPAVSDTGAGSHRVGVGQAQHLSATPPG